MTDRDGAVHSRSAKPSTRLLARNSLLNVAGQVGPVAVAVFAVPVLVRALGTIASAF